MPKVVRFHKTGGPEVLQIQEEPLLDPKSDEVRVKVKAIGLNRAEVMYRLGKYLQTPKLPSRNGYEASGVVDAIGPNVKGFAVGDVVSIRPHDDLNAYGVYGEYVNIPARYVIKHPSNLSFEEATSIWMQYLTAFQGLIAIANVKKGDHVVITAASSSVGLAAIQIVNYVGGIPIAVTRTEKKKAELLKAGAKHVVVTEKESLSERVLELTGKKGARISFDPIGGKGVLDLAKAASYEGIIIEYGGLSPDPTPYPLFESLAKALTMRGFTLFELSRDQGKVDEAIKFVVDGLKTGALKPIIAKVFNGLESIVEAHTYMESNDQFGKIVVKL